MLCIYIYIYVCIDRERTTKERERERDREIVVRFPNCGILSVKVAPISVEDLVLSLLPAVGSNSGAAPQC